MAKKKTRVLLPGGIQGLVHDLQNGTSNFAPRPVVDTDQIDEGDEEQEVPSVENNVQTTEEPAAQEQQVEVQPADNQKITQDSAASEVVDEQLTATNREDVSHEGGIQVEVTPVEDVKTPQTDTQESQPSGRGRRPKENTMREYHIVQDNSKDSWDLFVDMAQQYKNGGGKLATIYIDESLKSVLDRMKYAGPEKLSTSAILSSIVARFIYDHEDDIKKVLFSGNLL